MDAVSFPLMLDQNSSFVHIWLRIQAVAEDFHKVNSNAIFSPQMHFQQAGLKAMC